MLEITRRIGQSIIINENIRVELVRVDPKTGTAKLGIEAPREITVDRQEIHERKASDGDRPTPLPEKEIDKIIVSMLERATFWQILDAIYRVMKVDCKDAKSPVSREFAEKFRELREELERWLRVGG